MKKFLKVFCYRIFFIKDNENLRNNIDKILCKEGY